MSAFGPKRTSVVAPHMSAFGSKADIALAFAIAGPMISVGKTFSMRLASFVAEQLQQSHRQVIADRAVEFVASESVTAVQFGQLLECHEENIGIDLAAFSADHCVDLVKG